jgi:hypothetical protein
MLLVFNTEICFLKNVLTLVHFEIDACEIGD